MAANQENKGSNITKGSKGAPEISNTSQYQKDQIIKAEDGGNIWMVSNSINIPIIQYKF